MGQSSDLDRFILKYTLWGHYYVKRLTQTHGKKITTSFPPYEC